ncbi:hypothetical protein MBEHAL_0306 [Halarchaeum acidiphilum MH1-52-1]|uniref:Uncharacterized protein n=1 Tax=Halarchaeum acidiphilum MH1-52-1 TaxID=1261545 RepID=U2YD23_9EURY|nr:hypothetical protein [Halarchaeum acidiphilum]GAD51546.1 hypothetical protein MBEHAL_0306 [Halarchaeum acidiphilum MH1-52-1]
MGESVRLLVAFVAAFAALFACYAVLMVAGSPGLAGNVLGVGGSVVIVAFCYLGFRRVTRPFEE